MVNPSPMRVAGVDGSRSFKSGNGGRLPTAPKLAEVSPTTPRRLIRPALPAKTFATRTAGSGAMSALIARNFNLSTSDPRTHEQASHAETFYLQKQVHAKTLMVFVLDDGERIEGYIDWYDRNAMKVRYGLGRTLIYKRCIKYLYKAGEGMQI